MESRNPAFGRSKEFSTRGGYATFDSTPAYGSPQARRDLSPSEIQDMYSAPSATSSQTGRMTIDDVVMRTATVFGVLLVAAAATFVLIEPQQFGIVIGAAVVGFVLSLVVSFSKKIRPALILGYAAVEGVFVGGISAAFESAYDGIVAQAVLGTLGAFTAMLVLYKTGVIRATPKFTKMLLIAGAGYFVFILLNLLVSVFAGNSIYNSPLGFLVAGVGVVLASLFLVLDFDFVEQGIRNGLPREYAWTAAFGLTVTLVWLYIEILRLLAILRGDN